MVWKWEDEEVAMPGLARHHLATTCGWSVFFLANILVSFLGRDLSRNGQEGMQRVQMDLGQSVKAPLPSKLKG